MAKRFDTRKKLKSFVLKEDLQALLDKTLLTDRERDILRMFYIEKKQMADIAYELSVSESTVLKCHGKALDKVGEIL